MSRDDPYIDFSGVPDKHRASRYTEVNQTLLVSETLDDAIGRMTQDGQLLLSFLVASAADRAGGSDPADQTFTVEAAPVRKALGMTKERFGAAYESATTFVIHNDDGGLDLYFRPICPIAERISDHEGLESFTVFVVGSLIAIGSNGV